MSGLVRIAVIALIGLGLQAGAVAAADLSGKADPHGRHLSAGRGDRRGGAGDPAASRRSRLRQPVVIDNRPGAGGMIGVEAVAKSAPDGYVIGVGPMGALTVNVSLQEKMPYDTLKDLAPVSLLTTTPFVMAAPMSSPANTVGDVIALAKAKPGTCRSDTAAMERRCTSRRCCSTTWPG